MLADREITCNDVYLVATQPKPLFSQKEGDAYTRGCQGDLLTNREKITIYTYAYFN